MPSEKAIKNLVNSKLESLTVTELKHVLRSYGRKTNGRKSVLISRIESHQAQQHQHLHQVYLDRHGTTPGAMPAGTSKGTDAVKYRAGTSKSTNGLHVSQSETEFHSMTAVLKQEREDREKIVLWRQPLLTLQYFVQELWMLAKALCFRLYRRKVTVLFSLLAIAVCVFVYHTEGPHQQFVGAIEKQFLWCAYWVGLGVLSSVGLGTGLHTFLLYLGPHIAAVTLAAYECNSVDFPEPPYPNEIICPEGKASGVMTLLTIMSKVRLEAFMWGAGTAIGELPPYFMARAARLSGTDMEDDDFGEIEELLHDKKKHPDAMRSRSNNVMNGFLEKAKLSVHNLVQRVGFFGILACASIPNPLFDLAGITCGHFLIPFWTFFGATLIGKAIIKMHIQQLFVIFMFSAHHVESVVQLIGYIPYFGPNAQKPFQDYLMQQRTKLHHKPGEGQEEGGGNILGWCFEKLVLLMVAYFILSIFNSMAQNYHKRICQENRTQSKKLKQ